MNERHIWSGWLADPTPGMLITASHLRHSQGDINQDLSPQIAFLKRAYLACIFVDIMAAAGS